MNNEIYERAYFCPSCKRAKLDRDWRKVSFLGKISLWILRRGEMTGIEYIECLCPDCKAEVDIQISWINLFGESDEKEKD